MIDPMMKNAPDDVLYTKQLTYGRAVMIINIENVSHFIKTKSHVDKGTQ